MPMSRAPSLQKSHGLNKPMPPRLLLYTGESPPTIMVTVRPLVRQLGPSPAIWPDRPVTALPIHVAIPNLIELLEEFGVGQVPILPSYHDSPRILALASSKHNSTLSRVMIKSEDCTAALGTLLADNRRQTGGLYNDNDNSDYDDKSRRQLLLAEAYPITMSQLFCCSGAIALLFPVGYSPTTTSASALCWDSLPNKFAKLVNQTCISFPFRAPNVQHDKEQLPAHVPLQLVKLFEITHSTQYSYSPCVSPVYLAFATTALHQIFFSNPLFSRMLAASCHSIHHTHRTRQRVVVRIPLAKIRVIAADIQSMHSKQAFKIREIRKRSTQG
ncbi:uncharacterized protein B0T23DRAFT_405371 [Neurospora hispaniola]|uniref:Uncharacterized protein n=1 Tax=Neurospora hispaniola TaxID=588809 RepID=A0AAJ0MQC0_9PEZI|nr:hypothetical protein B0T23DRAFT_405371 [Neurospora hispaniola]